MQYKTFVWPNEPESFTVKMQRDAAQHTLLDGSFCVQELGCKPRSFSGEGVFLGENACEDFEVLRGLFLAGGSGTLVHPRWGSFPAILTELTAIEEPAENMVRYRFAFLECEGTEGEG